MKKVQAARRQNSAARSPRIPRTGSITRNTAATGGRIAGRRLALLGWCAGVHSAAARKLIGFRGGFRRGQRQEILSKSRSSVPWCRPRRAPCKPFPGAGATSRRSVSRPTFSTGRHCRHAGGNGGRTEATRAPVRDVAAALCRRGWKMDMVPAFPERVGKHSPQYWSALSTPARYQAKQTLSTGQLELDTPDCGAVSDGSIAAGCTRP